MALFSLSCSCMRIPHLALNVVYRHLFHQWSPLPSLPSAINVFEGSVRHPISTPSKLHSRSSDPFALAGPASSSLSSFILLPHGGGNVYLYLAHDRTLPVTSRSSIPYVWRVGRRVSQIYISANVHYTDTPGSVPPADWDRRCTQLYGHIEPESGWRIRVRCVLNLPEILWRSTGLHRHRVIFISLIGSKFPINVSIRPLCHNLKIIVKPFSRKI